MSFVPRKSFIFLIKKQQRLQLLLVYDDIYLSTKLKQVLKLKNEIHYFHNSSPV